jgi:aminopeptidase N
VAHEAAHQWFGDLITCASWAHVWLNEGFASYMPLLWFEHDEGRESFLIRLRGTRHGGLGAMDGNRKAVVTNVYARPFEMFGGHTYAGAAARLHMLRDHVGDEPFRKGVRHYVKTRAGTVAKTADFRRAMEEATGQDLKWWFQQWFRAPGYPRVKLRWKWDEKARSLVLDLHQTQRGKGVPEAYRFPFTIAVDLKDGSTHTDRFEVTQRKQQLRMTLQAAPLFVRPDPGTALFARFDLDRPDEEWAQLARLDPNPARRLDALDALAKAFDTKKGAKGKGKGRKTVEAGKPTDGKTNGTPARPDPKVEERRTAAAAALLDVLRNEPRPEVRAAAALKLGRRRENDVANALIRALENDADLRVRLAAAEALGSFEGILQVPDALRRALKSDHDMIRAKAVRSLAKTKAEGAFEDVVAALGRPGWQGHTAQACLEALADLGDERAFHHLATRVGTAADPWVRHVAIGACGRLGKKRPEYRDLVTPQLGDRRMFIRQRTADALKAVGDPDTIPLLKEALGREYWPRVEKALRQAIHACRREALRENRLVTVEVVRAAGLRAEYWKGHAALEARRGKDGKLPKGGETKRSRATLDRLRGELKEIGVGPGPDPAKVASKPTKSR